MSLRVGIVGLGLIGSSLARGLVDTCDLVGLDPAPGAAEAGQALGLATVADLHGLAGCDLVALAAPTAVNGRVLAELIEHGPRVPTMDLGSVKIGIDGVWRRDPSFPFVGTHPMAGSEQAGPASGSAELFAGSIWPVIVSPQTDPNALLLVLQVVLLVGGRPLPMTAERHDDAVALASHLPHLLAGALGATTAAAPVQQTVLTLAAGSFRDVGRVSASPPQRTAEFLTANRLRAAEVARAAAQHLERAADLLVAGDEEGVAAWLDRGHRVRQRYEGISTGAVRQARGPITEHVATGAEALRDLLVGERDSGRWVAGVDDESPGYRLRLAGEQRG